MIHPGFVSRDLVLQITIELSGRPDLHIHLPFGVDAGMGTAQVLDKGQTLKLMMPYKSYRSFTQVCAHGIAVAPPCTKYRLVGGHTTAGCCSQMCIPNPVAEWLHSMQDVCKRTPLINDYGFPDSYFMQLET